MTESNTTTPPGSDAASAVVDLRAIAEAGARRRKAEEAAERELATIVNEVARAQALGGEVNLMQVTRIGHVSRNTLYRRLEAARIS